MKELIELQKVVQLITKIKDIKIKSRSDNNVIARALFSLCANQYYSITDREIGEYLGYSTCNIWHARNSCVEVYPASFPLFDNWKFQIDEYYLKYNHQEKIQESIPYILDVLQGEARSNMILAEKNEELRQSLFDTRERLGDLSDFLAIPEKSMQDFKETRLIPYLKMLGIN
jgi:hypothetical protein